jgi:hypothetical protein
MSRGPEYLIPDGVKVSSSRALFRIVSRRVAVMAVSALGPVLNRSVLAPTSHSFAPGASLNGQPLRPVRTNTEHRTFLNSKLSCYFQPILEPANSVLLDLGRCRVVVPERTPAPPPPPCQATWTGAPLSTTKLVGQSFGRAASPSPRRQATCLRKRRRAHTSRSSGLGICSGRPVGMPPGSTGPKSAGGTGSARVPLVEVPRSARGRSIPATPRK